MFQSIKFTILVVAAFGSLTSALKYNVLPTELSAGVVNQDFAFPFDVVHEHTDTLYNKFYLEPKSIFPEYNFHVSIERGEESICSGAIVNGGQHVVTAASCDIKVTDIVRINSPKLRKNFNYKPIGIKCVTNHPNYHRSAHRFDYDIAILQLNEITTQTTLFPNSPDYKPNEGKFTHYSTLANWNFKDSLIVTKVPILSADVCRQRYNFHMTNNMLCAGAYSADTAFCSEDRGSPLFQRGILIGVKSWGEQCSRVVLPAVFTDVSKVKQWVLDTIISPNC